jgi:hypothetical protein
MTSKELDQVMNRKKAIEQGRTGKPDVIFHDFNPCADYRTRVLNVLSHRINEAANTNFQDESFYRWSSGQKPGVEPIFPEDQDAYEKLKQVEPPERFIGPGVIAEGEGARLVLNKPVRVADQRPELDEAPGPLLVVDNADSGLQAPGGLHIRGLSVTGVVDGRTNMPVFASNHPENHLNVFKRRIIPAMQKGKAELDAAAKKRFGPALKMAYAMMRADAITTISKQTSVEMVENAIPAKFAGNAREAMKDQLQAPHPRAGLPHFLKLRADAMTKQISEQCGEICPLGYKGARCRLVVNQDPLEAAAEGVATRPMGKFFSRVFYASNIKSRAKDKAMDDVCAAFNAPTFLPRCKCATLKDDEVLACAFCLCCASPDGTGQEGQRIRQRLVGVENDGSSWDFTAGATMRYELEAERDVFKYLQETGKWPMHETWLQKARTFPMRKKEYLQFKGADKESGEKHTGCHELDRPIRWSGSAITSDGNGYLNLVMSVITVADNPVRALRTLALYHQRGDGRHFIPIRVKGAVHYFKFFTEGDDSLYVTTCDVDVPSVEGAWKQCGFVPKLKVLRVAKGARFGFVGCVVGIVEEDGKLVARWAVDKQRMMHKLGNISGKDTSKATIAASFLARMMLCRQLPATYEEIAAKYHEWKAQAGGISGQISDAGRRELSIIETGTAEMHYNTESLEALEDRIGKDRVLYDRGVEGFLVGC